MEKRPHIKTRLPGPEAEKFLALDHQYVSPSYLRDYPLVVRRGEGMFVEDVDGNTFLDFNAGIAVVSTRCFPACRTCLIRTLIAAQSAAKLRDAPRTALARASSRDCSRPPLPPKRWRPSW